MPFVAIRDCIGFHASHEGLVGIVGELDEREVNALVHQYPGAVYKGSFVTADQAVQWLWSNVFCRVANQDLRAKQFLADTRLFPNSSAAHKCELGVGPSSIVVWISADSFQVLIEDKACAVSDVVSLCCYLLCRSRCGFRFISG